MRFSVWFVLFACVMGILLTLTLVFAVGPRFVSGLAAAGGETSGPGASALRVLVVPGLPMENEAAWRLAAREIADEAGARVESRLRDHFTALLTIVGVTVTVFVGVFSVLLSYRAGRVGRELETAQRELETARGSLDTAQRELEKEQEKLETVRRETGQCLEEGKRFLEDMRQCRNEAHTVLDSINKGYENIQRSSGSGGPADGWEPVLDGGLLAGTPQGFSGDDAASAKENAEEDGAISDDAPTPSPAAADKSAEAEPVPECGEADAEAAAPAALNREEAAACGADTTAETSSAAPDGEPLPERELEQAAVWCWRRNEQGHAGDAPCPPVLAEAMRNPEAAEKRAEQGDVNAQVCLGLMREYGEAVAEDPKKAVHWYRKAAEQGYAVAQRRLGVAYALGQGVEKDPEQAVAWFRKAAEQGHAAAQCNLGFRYARGEGVEKDPEQAAAWFRKAAEQGNAEAQRNLGVVYSRGEGLEKDPEQAAAWFRKAAEQGEAEAQRNLGVAYARGEGVEKDPKQAAAWFRKAAEQGHAAAQRNLGVAYARGEGVEKDPKQAARWFRKAAEQGQAEAALEMSRRFLNGDGVPENFVSAYAYLLLYKALRGDSKNVSALHRQIREQLSKEQITEAQAQAQALWENLPPGAGS